MRLPAVLALLKARLFSVPDVISFARTWVNVGVAAALAGDAVRDKPRRLSVTATMTATARRNRGRRMWARRMFCPLRELVITLTPPSPTVLSDRDGVATNAAQA